MAINLNADSASIEDSMVAGIYNWWVALDGIKGTFAETWATDLYNWYVVEVSSVVVQIICGFIFAGYVGGMIGVAALWDLIPPEF